MKLRRPKPDSCPVVYRIAVGGHVEPHWSQWFDGLAVETDRDADGGPVTTLTGPVADQPALRGILNRLWDLNLTLISVTRLDGVVADEPAGHRTEGSE